MTNSAVPATAFPLSPAQLSIWVAQKLAPSVPFTVAQYVDITGPLDPELLIAATDIACRRLESPAIRLTEVDGQPFQWIDWDVPYAMEYRDFRGEPDPVAAARAYMDASHRRPVDMNNDQLIVSEIMQVGEQRWFWYSRAHHVVMDGLGAISVQERTASVYTALLTDTTPPKTRALGVRKIYEYEEAYGTSTRYVSDREHWIGRLVDLPDARRLSGSVTAPSQAAITVGSDLPPDVAAAMADVAHHYNSSDVPVVLAAFAVYFGRMTDSDDVVLSLPVSGRTTTMLRESSGMMSNVVPLRITLDPAVTTSDLLQQVQVELTGALRHQRFRVEDMQRELDAGFVGSTSGGRGAFGPTVNIMMFDSEIRLGDVIGEYRILSSGPIDDLMVNLYPGVAGSSTRVDFLGNPGMYTAAELQGHHGRFLALLRSIVTAPEGTPIAELDITTDAERRELLAARTSPAAEPMVMYDLLRDAPRRDLNAPVNQLARELISRGLGAEDRVAVAIPRSPASVTAIWAVTGAGASFVPVDPADPRCVDVLTDSAVSVGLIDRSGLDTLARNDIDWIVVDDPQTVSAVSARSDRPIDPDERVRPVHVDNEAYLVHTSGSTGTPKGVSVTHCGLAALADEVVSRYEVSASSRVLHLAAPVFDAAIQEMLAAVTAGATLVVAPPDVTAGPLLGEFVVRERITHLITAPSVLATLEPFHLDGVEVFDVGGEACPPELVERFAADSRSMLNAYGPTETTVLATLSDPMWPDQPVVIGSPLRGVRTLVLDHRLRPVPPGGIGELYIGGDGVARGYRSAPGTTAARFVPDPAVPGARLYRSGDLVRWIADAAPRGAHSAARASGSLEYLGRTDFQVQINGRRVELGEVESALRAHPGVRDAVVVRRDGDPTSAGFRPARLTGYVVGGVDSADVLALARERLPQYMVPTTVVVLDAMPLTPGGKIDRRALPQPERATVTVYDEPRTHTEWTVAEIVSEVLGVEKVGRDNDFFELGGDSLSATRVLARINAELDSSVTLPALFEAPTVAALADAADAAIGPPSVDRQSISDIVVREPVPLSYGQQRMWIVNQVDTTSAAYNLPIAVRLGVAADAGVLVDALRDVVGRHDALRTYYPDSDTGPHQVVRTVDEVMPRLRTETIQPGAVDAALASAASSWFDVARTVPLKIRLLGVTTGELVVVIVAHHINADGWSVGPLTRDLLIAYSARLEGKPPQWHPLPVTYAQYAVWDRNRVDSRVDAGLEYWTDALAEYTDPAELPADRLRPRSQSMTSGHIDFGIDSELWRKVRALAHASGATPFMVVHAAVAVVLARLGGRARTVVGTPVAGRGDVALDDVVGMFVGTVPLAVTVDGSGSFADLLSTVKTADLGAVAHADVPFERVVSALNQDGLTDRHSLFQVMIAYDNAPRSPSATASMPFTVMPIDTGATEYDLALEFADDAGTVVGRIVYATDLYDRGTVENFAELVRGVLSAGTTNPDVGVDVIDLAPHTVAAVPGPVTGTLLDVFTDRGGIAIVDEFGDTPYADLDGRASRLARVLIDRGAVADSVVALSLPRSVDYIVAVWAVVKSGAAFMPVDPRHPPERRRAMLRDVRLGIGAGSEPDVEWLDPSAGRGLAPYALTDADRAHPVRPHNAAYVVHTSGSTGDPKPVTVTHGSVAELARLMPPRYGVTRRSRVLHGYSPNFDAAVLETVLAFATGATMVIAPPDLVGGEEMAAFLTEHAVTHYLSTPAILATVPPVASVRTVAVGGEALPQSVVDRWSPGRTMLNAYGLSETTVVSTLSDPLTTDTAVTIGRPIDSVAATVLDDRLRPVPLGGVGELYLAGPMLARGYGTLARESAARFVAADGGERRYRTGDRVRLRHDGQLMYLGRNDLQVQLRGQRLELGEVEATLRAHPGVIDAVADVRDGHVVAWVSGTVDADEARAWQAARVPSWAVASRVVVLEALPRTTNGKIDRRALTDTLPAPASPHEPTRTLDEDVVSAVFAAVLDTESVGATSSFFELGGDSLTATRAASRLSVALGLTVPVRLLFENPTPRTLAAATGALSERFVPLPPVTHTPTFGPMPLSSAERRMWLQSRIDPGSGAHNVAFRIDVPRSTDLHVLRMAIVDVVDRHRPLRTVYPAQSSGPVAVDVSAHTAVPLLRPRFVATSALENAIRDITGTGFDLTREVPLRIELLDSSSMTGSDDDELLMVVVVHHIAVDGGSIAPFAVDVETAYEARSRGREPEFTPLEVDYGDYRLWQRDVVSATSSGQLEHWTRTLKGLPEYLELPTGSPSRDESSAPVRFHIDAATRASLRSFAHAHGATQFVVLHAALAILLAELGGTSDIAIGTPVGGRVDPLFDPLVGMFVGTLALRTEVTPSTSWTDFVTEVRDRDLDAFAHQNVPFEDVVDALDPARTADSHPFFQVLLAVQNIEAPTLRLGEYEVQAEQLDVDDVQFDLEFVLADSDDGIDGMLGYSSRRFSRATVASMAERFGRVLRTVAADPTIAIGDVDVLTSAERRVSRGGGGAAAATAVTLGELLRSAVAIAPHATAVVGERRTLTYAQLDVLSDRLSRRLIEHGAGPGRIVAIALPRSVEYVVAMWAAAKAGSGFLPIDPSYPVGRITDMLTEVDPVVGVTDVLNLPLVGAIGTWVDYGSALPDSAYRSGDTTAYSTYYAPPHLDDAAYVIYTSGSTGTPKGVRVTHRGLADLVAAQRERFGVTPQSRVLQFASPSFDASVFEMLLGFGSGAAVVVVPGGVYAGRELESVLVENNVTHVCLTPSVLQSTDPAAVPGVRTVIMAGEPSNSALVGRWSLGRDVYDAYGPTETTIMATCSTRLHPGDPATIGAPTLGLDAMVLDSRLRLVPNGVVGELYLAGSALAEGYVSRPGSTAERFVPNVLGEPGTRMYRTGDLVRWNDSGDTGSLGFPMSLEFLGRADTQIKIRGHRVELAEVEAALLRHPGVHQVTVTGRYSAGGAPALAAYIVGPASPSEVRELVGRTLPPYMIPAAITTVKALPLTVSGKVDTASLPSPTFGGASYRAPSTPTEHVVAAVMGRVLFDDDTTRVGADDNFFELGGHSLAAVRVMDSLREALGRPIPVIWLFAEPTPAALAARIDAGDNSAVDSALAVLLPIRPSGELPPLFCIHPAIGVAWSYTGLTSAVHPDRPLYGLQVPGLEGGKAGGRSELDGGKAGGRSESDDGSAPTSIEEYARRYVAEIRRVQPTGPYHLLGWSLGGVIAHAMASLLEKRGDRVALLALLDSHLDVATDAPEFTVADLADQLGVPGAADFEAISTRLHEQRSELAFLTPDYLERMFAPVRDAPALVERYTPSVVDADLDFFAARASTASRQWVPFVSGDVTVHRIDAEHEHLGEHRSLASIGRILEAVVDARRSSRGVMS
ncbi:non-ribosomal peptide synthetase [Rhodococcoides trifolii]|uniref:non-ribosomal peptide synthetase n=1 Tax=Rhodococcoides trifolii TaxID=908250 RepID=UPI00166B4866|nr:non-ribosomal peptide synthetase [Rhodococcus trifolii]